MKQIKQINSIQQSKRAMKLFLFFSFLFSLFIFSSCSKSGDVPMGSEEGDQLVVFTVGTPTTRATVEGLTRYIVEAYEAKDLAATPMRVESATGTLELALKKNIDYTFVFWADKGTAKTESAAGSGYWNTADLKAVTVTEAKKNDKGEVAYCLGVSFNTKDFEANKTVLLKNATARVDFIEAAGVTTADNTLKVNYAAGVKLNVATGVATEVAGEITHTFTAIAKAAKDTLLATDYVLAPQGEKNVANLNVQFNTEPPKPIANVPFRQNFKTSIRGEYSNMYASMFTISSQVDDYQNNELEADLTLYKDNTSAKEPEQGKGTSDSPYLIESASNIKWMQQSNTENKYYKLMTDIEIVNITWQPIVFHGEFDGNGHTITGKMAVKNVTSCFGFFGTVSASAIIRNLTNAAEVDAPNAKSVGGIAGQISPNSVQKPILINCKNTAKITGKYNVGGIVGSYSYASNDTEQPGEYVLISDCENTGDITSMEESMPYGDFGTGGIIGDAYLQPSKDDSKYDKVTFVLQNCKNTGNISAPKSTQKDKYSCVGGITADIRLISGILKIKGCSSTGVIKIGETLATDPMGDRYKAIPGLISGGQFEGYDGVIVIED